MRFHPDPGRRALVYVCAAVVVLFAVVGCKQPVSLSAQQVLERGVAEFHSRYNDQKYEEIYAHSTSYYRARNPRELSRSVLRDIRESYGRALRTRVKTFRPSPGGAGMGVVGVVTTEFEKGVAEETFTLVHYSARDEIALFSFEPGLLH